MTRPDLNLLVTLEALLTEGSVAGAARRLRLSPSAMSRSLARLRQATGDPLLVRAGRGLVPTPRALELAGQVGQLVRDAEAALRPTAALDLPGLTRRFALRATDGFAETFAPGLLARVAKDAPNVLLHFLPKADRDSARLRDGSVDVETGVIGQSIGPEVRAQAIFADRYIGVVRHGHPLIRAEVTLERFLACAHVAVSRRDATGGSVDAALETRGLARTIAVTVGGFSAALALARSSDLVASIPERQTAGLRAGMETFELPLVVPGYTVSMLWHPRNDADPAHRWLRRCIREVCGTVRDAGGTPAS